MKKIITIIIAIIITTTICINYNIKNTKIKAEEERTIQFMYKNIITSEEDTKLNAMGNTSSQSNIKNENTGIFESTKNDIKCIISMIYYTKTQSMVTQYGGRVINIIGYYNSISNTGQWQNFFIRYEYNQNENNEYEYINSFEEHSSTNNNPITIAEFYEREWSIIDYTIFNGTRFQNLKNIMWKDAAQKLETPTISIEYMTITWQSIENAEYYIIYKNGNLIGQTTSNMWVTIENGTYSIQACTNNENFKNSDISNSVTQNQYNDLIGNGANWYTFMSALVDTTIYLLKSMLNYEIWGINFFKLLQLVTTLIITALIIKFIIGG